jgi:hypothetical protein
MRTTNLCYFDAGNYHSEAGFPLKNVAGMTTGEI